MATCSHEHLNTDYLSLFCEFAVEIITNNTLNHEMKIHVIKFLRYLSNGAEVVDLLLECRIVENVLVAMTSFPFSRWRLINEELIQPRQLDRKARRHYDYGMEAYCCGVGEALQVYEGLQNAQTVKGVNVFGANTEYVVSGSEHG